MYNKSRPQEVSTVKQSEDKNSRYDYGKVRVDLASGLVGENENIKDSR